MRLNNKFKGAILFAKFKYDMFNCSLYILELWWTLVPCGGPTKVSLLGLIPIKILMCIGRVT